MTTGSSFAQHMPPMRTSGINGSISSIYGYGNSTPSLFETGLIHESLDCRLTLMDLNPTGAERTTQFGPLMILGMPWFRKYYTTFNLGDGTPTTKQIHVAEAD